MTTDRALAPEQLVRRALRGETEAFGALVDLYRHQVYGVCWHALRHREEAEDAAQEAFLQAFSRLDTLREPAKFAGWLRQIAVNVCRMRQRSAEPPAVSLDEADALPAPETDAALHIVVTDALNALPETIRLPFVLRHIDGLSYDEIAEFLDTSRDTVRGRIYTARKQLQEELRDMAEEFIQQERLDAGFTKRVKEKLFWHEQPIEVTQEVPPDSVILVYLDLFNRPRIDVQGTTQGPLRITGRKVFLGTSAEEAEGRAEQVRVVAQLRNDVFQAGPADAQAFRGVCWTDAGAQPSYHPIRGEWDNLKRELAEFPEALDCLKAALNGNCVTVATYNNQLAPIWLPPAVLTGRVKQFIGAAGWSGDGDRFCAAGGAEISLTVPPCRTLVVVPASRQEVRLADLYSDVMVLTPDLHARFSAQRISGDLTAYGATPTHIEKIGGDLRLCAPRYGDGGCFSSRDKWARREVDEHNEHRQVVIKDVQGELHAEVVNLDLELSRFGKQVRVKNSYGSIAARLSDYDPDARLIFQTVTGHVTLTLPRTPPKGWHVALWSEGGGFDWPALTEVRNHCYDARSMYVGTLPPDKRETANLQVITGLGNVLLQRSGQRVRRNT
jgi:RNA polymerase sigma-70 factor (ECF subfamily)